MRAFLIVFLIGGLMLAFQPNTPLEQNWEDRSVAEVLQALGEDAPDHLPNTNLKGVSAEAGRKLVHEGIAIAPKGLDADRQSKHFLCTSCHNTTREDPDLTQSDPEARLSYAIKEGLPFLPGTTLYGVVNRESYYNGDYEKKYGDLVQPARKSLRGAIHLCATECAQGRTLEDWEMESILAYLWTIDIKMADLNLSGQTKEHVDRALERNVDQADAIRQIKAAYLQASPATFVLPPPDRKTGYEGLTGRPDQGGELYRASCLHCHENQRYSFFTLDDQPLSLQFLAKHFDRYTRYSVYQVGRYGTSPIPGKKAYMPHYPAERMSNQQMEDLKAYVNRSIE